MEIRFDASHNQPMGYFECPHCQKIFGAGSKQDNINSHKPECPVREKRLEETIYYYGKKEIRLIRSQYNSFGESFFRGSIQKLILEKEILNQ